MAPPKLNHRHIHGLWLFFRTMSSVTNFHTTAGNSSHGAESTSSPMPSAIIERYGRSMLSKRRQTLPESLGSACVCGVIGGCPFEPGASGMRDILARTRGPCVCYLILDT